MTCPLLADYFLLHFLVWEPSLGTGGLEDGRLSEMVEVAKVVQLPLPPVLSCLEESGEASFLSCVARGRRPKTLACTSWHKNYRYNTLPFVPCVFLSLSPN